MLTIIVYSFARRLGFLLLLSTTSVTAHEAWILPWDFHLDDTNHVRAHIQVGQMLDGSSQLYNPDRFERLEVVSGGTTKPIHGRVGDLPAISHKLQTPGLHTLVYESSGSIISYGNWEKFRKFTDTEGVSWAQEEHRSRGHPEEDFDEVFIRCAKALITHEGVEGADRRVGMPAEIVALNNPYADGDHIDLQVWWQDQPYADAQVAVFTRTPDGETTREDRMTDREGKLTVPLEDGTRYLFNSVTMEPLDNGRNTPLWRSYWASMMVKMP